MPSRTMSSFKSAARRRTASRSRPVTMPNRLPASRHSRTPMPSRMWNIIDLPAVVEEADAAVGHHAVDVAENELDLGTSFGEGHEAVGVGGHDESSCREAIASLRRAFGRKDSHAGFAGFAVAVAATSIAASAFSPNTSVTSTSPIGRPSRSTTGSSLNFRVANSVTASPTRVPLRHRRRAGDHHVARSAGRVPLRRAARTAAPNRYR